MQLGKEKCRVNERNSSLKLSEKFCSSNHVTNDVTTLKAHIVCLLPSKKRYSPRVPHLGPKYSPLNRETANVTWPFVNVLKHCVFQLFNVWLHTDKRCSFRNGYEIIDVDVIAPNLRKISTSRHELFFPQSSILPDLKLHDKVI